MRVDHRQNNDPRDRSEVTAPDYREEQWFQNLREKVKGIIAAHQPVTSNTIKNLLGDDHDTRRGYTEAAIDDLIGEIERVQKGSMYFYLIAGTRHQVEAIAYNRARFLPPDSRTYPTEALYDPRRKVTA